MTDVLNYDHDKALRVISNYDDNISKNDYEDLEFEFGNFIWEMVSCGGKISVPYAINCDENFKKFVKNSECVYSIAYTLISFFDSKNCEKCVLDLSYKKLVEYGFNPNTIFYFKENNKYYTLLTNELRVKFIDIRNIKTLIELGSNVNLVLPDGSNSLSLILEYLANSDRIDISSFIDTIVNVLKLFVNNGLEKVCDIEYIDKHSEILNNLESHLKFNKDIENINYLITFIKSITYSNLATESDRILVKSASKI